MFSAKTNSQRTEAYAGPCDLVRTFHDHAEHLYTLCLLLTSDHGKAEQCLLQAVDDCLRETRIFREWAYSWARRATVKAAIRMISPTPDRSHLVQEARNGAPSSRIQDGDALLLAIAGLETFDRFVYVTSVLEGLPARDCCILLNCTGLEFNNARVRTLQRIGESFPTAVEDWPAAHFAESSLRQDFLQDFKG